MNDWLLERGVAGCHALHNVHDERINIERVC
jgi:hypothetical protein